MNAKKAKELTNEANNRIDECKIYQAMDDIKFRIECAARCGHSRCAFKTRLISPRCVLKKGTQGSKYSLTEPEISYLVNETKKLGFRVTNFFHGIEIKW